MLNQYQQLESLFTAFLCEVILQAWKTLSILRTICSGMLKNVAGPSLGTFSLLLKVKCKEY